METCLVAIDDSIPFVNNKTYLGTKMKVAEEDGRLGAGDDENDKNKEKESVHVVNLRGPDRVEDKEQLDKDASKGQNAAHHDTRDGLGVDTLLGYLSGNLVSAYGVLNAPFTETEKGSDEGQGDGDAEPQGQQGHQGEEWNGRRGSLGPKNEVHDKEMSKHDSEKNRRKQIIINVISDTSRE
jgi:hypothetical protein